MNIKKIIGVLEENNLLVSSFDYDFDVNYLSYDSRDIKKDTLFICKGVKFKEEYLVNSISSGVVCYISENLYSVNIPGIIVNDIRKALALLSYLFYPDNLFKIGITGTKGKTTTNYFIHNILKNHLGYRPGIIATHSYYDGNVEGENHLTTPESLELHKYLNTMSNCGLKYMSMEVSSQATKHDRVFGMDFDIGVFLNISEDHISTLEHPDFEDYFSSKLEFLKLCNKVIVFNETDYYDRVLEAISGKEVITFGYSDADYVIRNIKNNGNLSFELFDGEVSEVYEIAMPGRFNIVNAVSAIIIGKCLGVSYKDICLGLMETFVSGRMNVIDWEICPVIVDYAHNKLSAEALYKSLKEDYPDRKIKVVFGCPGDKGLNRRSEMGELAGKYADYVYLTSEDPGNSSVLSICDDIIESISKYHNNYEVIVDREDAISKALTDANNSDVIALLGKGDENYQIVGNEYIPYETDKVIVERFISKVGVK